MTLSNGLNWNGCMLHENHTWLEGGEADEGAEKKSDPKAEFLCVSDWEGVLFTGNKANGPVESDADNPKMSKSWLLAAGCTTSSNKDRNAHYFQIQFSLNCVKNW